MKFLCQIVNGNEYFKIEYILTYIKIANLIMNNKI